MANHRCVVEWQQPGDRHWGAANVLALGDRPELIAALREVVPVPQGFSGLELSPAAAAERDAAVPSSATVMTAEEVASAQAAYERTNGEASKELKVVLAGMAKYAASGLTTRFVCWET